MSLPLEGIVQSFICLDKYLGVFIWVNNTSVPTQNMYFTPTFMNIFRTKEVPVSFDFWLDILELFTLPISLLLDTLQIPNQTVKCFLNIFSLHAQNLLLFGYQ